MPITVEEKFDSRDITRGQSASAVLNYVIKGTDDDLAALTELQNTIPETYDGLPCLTANVQPIAPLIWLGTARYGLTNQQDTGTASFSFDTGGGSQHITQSIATVNRYAPPGKTAPDFKGAINVTDNSVDGVDIVVPVYNWSDTYYKASVEVTDAYKNILFNLTGTVNNAGWHGYNAGEVMFLGASGSKRGYFSDWEIAYRFAASPNKTGITIGDITGIAKKGWEYLWVRYGDAEDTIAKALIKKPIAVYIEQVCEYGNFGLLGI
jgi:hypothetical protein